MALGLRKSGLFLVLASALFLFLPRTSAPARAALSQVSILEVQVKLFYANSGRFSSNLATKKDVALWNVAIGEGAGVDGPSDNTLLVVTVAGPARELASDLRLKVVAKTERGTVLERSCDVGIFNGNGNWYAPFLIYGTGCEPIVVTAELTQGKETGSPVVFTIPFACGE